MTDRKKVILAILDGFGERADKYYNAVAAANKPNYDMLRQTYPHASLSCSGLDVGLPEGQMGNSEVGHLNLGAGRIVYQELSRISKSIDDGDFFDREAFLTAFANAKKNNTSVHIMGLVSNGGVHSATKHYKALVEMAKRMDCRNFYIHCFMDGRDTPPQSGLQYITELEEYLSEVGYGTIATVSGRYYAMDRDKRYERIALAYDAMVEGIGEVASSAREAMEQSYEQSITDEFVLPTVIQKNNQPIATIDDGDSVVFFNFRPDRARQMSHAISGPEFDGFERRKKVDVTFVTMTSYDETLRHVLVAYAPNAIEMTLGEYISKMGLKQLRIAETEKYAHVTYFFNGGVEDPYLNEDRVMIPSPRVATYDLQPEMSAFEVTAALVERIVSEKYDLIIVNYANCDMVGHTGIYDAAIKAVETVDTCIGKVYHAAKEHGYDMLITADHGNAEYMREENDGPHTAHTTNKVPLIAVSDHVKHVADGRLCDVAPTLLAMMNLKQPNEMDGISLID